MSSKLPLDSNYDLEQQFILRMTDPIAAETLSADIESGVSFRDNFSIEFKQDMRHAVVRYNGQVYQGRLMDLPCVIESLKTTDKSSFYKTADICQMMVCTQSEDTGPLRGTAAYLDDRARSWSNSFDASREAREFQFLHGITAPLKNVLRRRFRKSRRKRFIDMPKIEKEVKQLLRADLQAVGVKWEVLWSDPSLPGERQNASDEVSDDTRGGMQQDGQSLQTAGPGSSRRPAAADDEVDEEDEEGTRPFPIDRRDVFGELSSSSMDSSDSTGASDDERAAPAGSSRSLHDRLDSVGRSEPKIDSGRGNLKGSQVSARGLNSMGFSDANIVGTLKDELAAELLLSDSGDEGDSTRNRFQDDGSPLDEDGLEDDLQASVAAQLVARASESHTLDENEVQVDVDDVDDLDDDEDDLIHRGGELLDDAALMGFDSGDADRHRMRTLDFGCESPHR